MRLLLDTHAFLWWLDGDERLPPYSRKIVGGADNEIYVSAASAWEIATKVRIGKLPGAADVSTMLLECIASQGFVPLDITVEHAQRAGALPEPHRDPFDRMLIAQAQAEDLAILTNDPAFKQYGVRRIWQKALG